jgi:hypothetical protein
MLLAFLAGFSGLILDSVARGRRETKQLAYLALPAPLGASAAAPSATSLARPPHHTGTDA